MNYIENYQQIAYQHGLLFYDNRDEINAYGADNGNKVRIKYAVMQKDCVFYCAYDMYAPKAYMNCTYSGFYIEMDSKYLNLTCKINRKINPFIDFFLCNYGKKTGNSFADKYLTIRTNDIGTVRQFITDDFVEKYIKFNNENPSAIIIIGRGEDILSNIPYFKNKIVMGIQVAEWINPVKLIDSYDICRSILNDINKNCSTTEYDTK